MLASFKTDLFPPVSPMFFANWSLTMGSSLNILMHFSSNHGVFVALAQRNPRQRVNKTPWRYWYRCIISTPLKSLIAWLHRSRSQATSQSSKVFQGWGCERKSKSDAGFCCGRLSLNNWSDPLICHLLNSIKDSTASSSFSDLQFAHSQPFPDFAQFAPVFQGHGGNGGILLSKMEMFI